MTCLGIDVLAEDISRPWTDGNLGIIEINAGPGVFMHLAPAIGEPVDVPGMIIRAHFPRPGRSGSRSSPATASASACATRIYERLRQLPPGSRGRHPHRATGCTSTAQYFHNNPRHDQNVRIVLRNPRLDFAVFNHSRDDLVRFGAMHQGADVVVLEDPDPAEEVLARDLLPGGVLHPGRERHRDRRAAAGARSRPGRSATGAGARTRPSRGPRARARRPPREVRLTGGLGEAMFLFKECEVFSPEPLGRKDVLLAGARVVALADDDPRAGRHRGARSSRPHGLRLIPGLVDGHVHIAGAGGEGGPATRTPEMHLARCSTAASRP